ncbi:phytanoyl-CoA dioxygenase family protein [Granulosicoccus antarcticus]|uniref:1-deoxypentalenic acid 11-beta-hydroxylase n=1 Tax=Granulosicoccus antarcticus IMCC3135 TaxID=1192854 RepID=A0A2Z2NRI0_9GAMM|nr:phytanoyl-CoA dioxygenase family protein [Granulosicoccus antarcticus]ASJ71350.1 1-deoxypentalenic acid 11-beta-hydroxylase [Granulosicoccus antarcticus IMCC3135]
MNANNQLVKEAKASSGDKVELKDDWVQQYERDGYLFPLKAMDPAQALEYRKQMECFEASVADKPDMRKMALLNGAYLLPFVDEITRLESILEPVKQLLGPNIMVWNAGFFIKEPRTEDFISWHQDLTYWGLSDSHEVTAWVALSPSTIASGCVKFVAGTHKQDIVEHKDTFEKNNLLSRGQEIAVEVKEEEAVNIQLQPGEMSLHHGKVFHGSHANTSDDRRIGLAIRYISTDMRQTIEEKTTAKLVAGVDEFDNFRQVGKPRGVLDPEDIASLEENMRIQQQFLYAGSKK